MNAVMKLPEYIRDKFVGREEQLDLTRRIAQKIRDRESVQRRTLIFTGERAVGKSWLLGRLADLLSDEFRFTVLKVNLKDYPIDTRNAESAASAAAGKILLKLAELLEYEPRGTSVPELSRNVIEVARAQLHNKLLAVCVDHVYESDWNLLAALEDYVLGPLAIEPRVLIVMAGRGRPYPFKTPELRFKAELIELHPFESQETAEQLKSLEAAKVEKIYRLSGGNPGANYLLALHPEATAEALNEVIEGMLEPVPEGQRQQVREYLEALCVLNAFDEGRIPTMLAAYYKDRTYEQWTYAQARDARELLTRWAFARWDADQGGYVVHDMSRKLLEQYLQSTWPERWKDLQCAAEQLYNNWVAKFTRSRERWEAESSYHSGQLQKMGQSCPAISAQ
ncbi:MAG: ATP-binding protein [Anaerolineae bacterium]|nr:ATP-binding protein [Anaerolineae bacterium]